MPVVWVVWVQIDWLGIAACNFGDDHTCFQELGGHDVAEHEQSSRILDHLDPA